MNKEKEEKFILTDSLREWRKERNINNISRETYVKQVLEELLELYLTDKKAIDKNTLALYDSWFKHLEGNMLSVDSFIDVTQDIQVFSVNASEILGYDNNKCNEEVFKHISCRKQDPQQKAEWDTFGSKGQKWQKWREQPLNELYEPNYEVCKLNSNEYLY